jgi:hypothetical protein
MALIGALANSLQLGRWPGDPDTIVELGDMEITSLLARRPGGCTFETTNRGRRSIEAFVYESTSRNGHRSAKATFSTAALAEVTASLRHRNGEPLFDLGQRPRPPGPP